jgi:phage shock protein A
VNPLSIFKYGAGALIVLGAYFFGLNQGQNSEQLKTARSQISQLTATVQNYETQYKNQAIALAELRIAESSARNDVERMRNRINVLENRAKTTSARDTVQCLRLEQEARGLLLEARSAIEYCRRALSWK